MTQRMATAWINTFVGSPWQMNDCKDVEWNCGVLDPALLDVYGEESAHYSTMRGTSDW
jgi:hypothetical protein